MPPLYLVAVVPAQRVTGANTLEQACLPALPATASALPAAKPTPALTAYQPTQSQIPAPIRAVCAMADSGVLLP